MPTEFGEPSPQSMVAVKSLAGAPGLASVKLAMPPANDSPVAAGKSTAGPGVSAASAMTAKERPETVIGVAPSPSVTSTSTW